MILSLSASLIRTVMAVRAKAPDEWEELLRELGELGLTLSAQHVKAPVELLPVTKGRAEVMFDLVAVLSRAPATFETLCATEAAQKDSHRHKREYFLP